MSMSNRASWWEGNMATYVGSEAHVHLTAHNAQQCFFQGQPFLRGHLPLDSHKVHHVHLNLNAQAHTQAPGLCKL